MCIYVYTHILNFMNIEIMFKLFKLMSKLFSYLKKNVQLKNLHNMSLNVLNNFNNIKILIIN